MEEINVDLCYGLVPSAFNLRLHIGHSLFCDTHHDDTLLPQYGHLMMTGKILKISSLISRSQLLL